MKIDEPDSLQEQHIDCVPVIVCGRRQGKQWALYDRRIGAVQIWKANETRQLTLLTETCPLDQDKLPKFMTWLDEGTLVLADAIASIWLLDLNFEEGSIVVTYKGRLATKGIFALQSNDCSLSSFWVGTNGSCDTYRLVRQGNETRLVLSRTDCLNHGVVKEVCKVIYV